ncbi:phage Gp37/Gp68 family protein [Mycobacterium sp. CSUR Q5927]|nr:phage Gp37/Gp68 family protein [Mycobacterium sp. CSUR Q5927]
MADHTTIEWTDATWNPVTGCTEVSPGCDHCYAKTIAERFRGTPGHYFEHGFDVQLRPDKLDLPLRWRRPRRVFVNSMSDLFHEQVPDAYIARVFAVMADAERHTFQVLTKRHARMRALLSSNEFQDAVLYHSCHVGEGWNGYETTTWQWPLSNVWLGVSTENQRWADIRIPALLDTPAAVRWISAEPLLGPIDLRAWAAPVISTCDPVTAEDGPFLAAVGRAACRKVAADLGEPIPAFLDWVVVGGESGRGARPMHPDWTRSLRDQCQAAGVPFLFKQWGEWAPVNHRDPTLDGQVSIPYRPGCPDPYPLGWVRRVGKKAAGRELDGRTWDQFPAVS